MNSSKLMILKVLSVKTQKSPDKHVTETPSPQMFLTKWESTEFVLCKPNRGVNLLLIALGYFVTQD